MVELGSDSKDPRTLSRWQFCPPPGKGISLGPTGALVVVVVLAPGVHPECERKTC